MALLHSGAATASPIVNQSQARIGVDADPSGNTATGISDVQDCHEAGLGDSFEIDVFVEDVIEMNGFQFDLLYSPDVVNVTGVDLDSENTFLVSGPSGSLIDFSQFDDVDAMEDTDGTFTAAVADFFGDAQSGKGVLARISLRAIGTGQSNLALSNVILTSPNAEGSASQIEGVIMTNAAVAVGESCVAPEQPPPATPPPPTPTPSATEAATGPDGTVDNSTTWIVIGVAASAVALIAAGGTFAWQRGKQD